MPLGERETERERDRERERQRETILNFFKFEDFLKVLRGRYVF